MAVITRRWLGLGASAFLLAGTMAPAAAQNFPSRPVRMIVPFAAGGPADLLARAIAPGMSTELGQPVVIENHAGGGGTIGVDAVAKSAPDGYTFGITGPGALVAAPFMTKVPYDATKDLAAIARVARVNGVIVVSAQSPYKTLADVIAAARAAPGKLTFGSAGAGTLTHLAGELLNMEANIKIVHVPYRGAVPAATDLLGGHIDLLLPDLPGVLPQIRAGSIRGLAISSAARSPSVPGDSDYRRSRPAECPRRQLVRPDRACRHAAGYPQKAFRCRRGGAQKPGGAGSDRKTRRRGGAEFAAGVSPP